MDKSANILDPIHDRLDTRVFKHAGHSRPKLKPEHRSWILNTVYSTLRDHGYHDIEDWLSLVFTGSLTTYQYSEQSDVDVSLFVDIARFPEWSRAEMIGIMVSEVDGTPLPGTPFPMQCFVVPPEVKREDLYKPGLRSGYDLDKDEWIVPPEKSRVRDVKREMNAAYVYALECADKMERLLRYEPDKAITFWHQIHKRRKRDHQAGKGDFSQANIVYKFLANRGLFPKISELSGEYIAKTAGVITPEGGALPWEPGGWGKGVVVGNKVYAWTDRPGLSDENIWHHDDVLDKLEKDGAFGPGEKVEAMFFIDPDGEIVEGYDLDQPGWTPEQIAAADPRFNAGKRGWSFGKTAMKVMRDDSEPDPTNHDILGDRIPVLFRPAGERVHHIPGGENLGGEDILYIGTPAQTHWELEQRLGRLRDGMEADRGQIDIPTNTFSWLNAFDKPPPGSDEAFAALTQHFPGLKYKEPGGYTFGKTESPFAVTLKTMRRDGYSEDDIQAWWDYLAANNEDDRDNGELDAVPDEQVERWYENWESEGRPRVSKTAGLYSVLPDAMEEARKRHGLELPVRVLPLPPQHHIPPKERTQSGYGGIDRDPMTGKPSHRIHLNHDLPLGAANWALHHELAHAAQTERTGDFESTKGLAEDVYRALPREKDAEAQAAQHADLQLISRTAKPRMPIVRKWVYNAGTGQLVIGEQGPEEGVLPSHNQLAKKIGVDFVTDTYHLGTVSKTGWVTFEGGGGKTSARTRYAAEQALKKALPDEIQGFLGGETQLGEGADNGKATVPSQQWEFGA